MSLNSQVSAERLHIGFFGLRNAGKSSVVNAVTGQALSLVSAVKGTTTDPVHKAMELLPLGPVVVIDTPGLDDEGELGEMRVRRARQVLAKTDIAVLVVDAALGMQPQDEALCAVFRERQAPYIVALNKCDLLAEIPAAKEHEIYVSARRGDNIYQLKEAIAAIARLPKPDKRIVGDLLEENDVALLVTPIDASAPRGRLILPQQQTLRDILDRGAIGMAVQTPQLPTALAALKAPPRLVITDSQAFEAVSRMTPEEIPLTSFSILFMRYKGELSEAVRGAAALDRLRDGDTVLISEGCTHHRQCDDIGTVKIPRWLGNYTGKQLNIATSSGKSFPEELEDYQLVIHCGGCMLSEREVRYRMKCAQDQKVPITNYGIAIAYMKGILRRSIAMFPKLLAELEENT